MLPRLQKWKRDAEPYLRFGGLVAHTWILNPLALIQGQQDHFHLLAAPVHYCCPAPFITGSPDGCHDYPPQSQWEMCQVLHFVAQMVGMGYIFV
jgi:hypothetical protein